MYLNWSHFHLMFYFCGGAQLSRMKQTSGWKAIFYGQELTFGHSKRSVNLIQSRCEGNGYQSGRMTMGSLIVLCKEDWKLRITNQFIPTSTPLRSFVSFRALYCKRRCRLWISKRVISKNNSRFRFQNALFWFYLRMERFCLFSNS